MGSVDARRGLTALVGIPPGFSSVVEDCLDRVPLEIINGGGYRLRWQRDGGSFVSFRRHGNQN